MQIIKINTLYMGEFSTRIITDVSEFLSSIDKNDNLFSPSKIHAPSLNISWLIAFVRHYGKSRKLVIANTKENGITTCLAPFHQQGDGELELLCNETSDYNDVFYTNPSENNLQIILEELFLSGINSIKFTQLPSDSETINYLQTISKRINTQFQLAPCNVLPVVVPIDKPVSSWDGVQSSLVKKYERRLRRLQSLGKVKFSTITTKDDFEAEFPNMMKMHIERWKRINIDSKFLDLNRQTFTREICEEAISKNTLLAHLLKIDDVMAAYNIGFLCNKTLFDWNTSFSLQFEKMSPGALLQLHTFMRFKELGFERYNFMKGSEPYKFIWTKKTEKTVTIVIKAT